MSKTVWLSVGQRVRIPGDSWATKIVFTMTFYDPRTYPYSVEHFNEVNHTKGGVVAGAYTTGCSVTADYPGKQADMAKDRAEYEAAPLIETGDTIRISGDGCIAFTAEVIGRRVCDPVHFRII